MPQNHFSGIKVTAMAERHELEEAEGVAGRLGWGLFDINGEAIRVNFCLDPWGGAYLNEHSAEAIWSARQQEQDIEAAILMICHFYA